MAPHARAYLESEARRHRANSESCLASLIEGATRALQRLERGETADAGFLQTATNCAARIEAHAATVEAIKVIDASGEVAL